MRVIKEHYLDNFTVGPQTRYISQPAEIVDINYYSDEGIVTLICIENKVTAGSTLRTFQICDKDETIYHEGIVKYIGHFNGDFGTRYVVELK